MPLVSNLVINERGIFPTSDCDKASELRARTFLYFADIQGYLQKVSVSFQSSRNEDGEEKVVWIYSIHPFKGLTLDEIEWITTVNNEGHIYLANPALGWSGQIGRLILVTDDPHKQMEAYFQTPSRWLSDRGYERLHLEKALKELV